MALVSRRFYNLVTSPHAWRIAFSRFFPSTDALINVFKGSANAKRDAVMTSLPDAKTEKRVFTRLTALASWRSEYILRTRLLRCLERGKPLTPYRARGAPLVPRSAGDLGGRAAITYSSGLQSPVTHLHASFAPTESKRPTRFLVGAEDVGCARCTDVATAKVDAWGTSDPQTFLQFEQRFIGQSLWGLGEGNVVATPNVMDLSQPFGMVHGEGSPGGLVYFRAADEKRGRFLAFSAGVQAPHLGVPKISGATEAMCAVWIAKSARLLSVTDGLIGILSGSSYGVLTAYSLGTDGGLAQRLRRAEITARWVLSPGVPIIAIAVDDNHGAARRTEGRSWIAVLNALGEVYHLADLPQRQKANAEVRSNEEQLELLAWETGRSVCWQLIESTKRILRPDSYGKMSNEVEVLSRTSCNGSAFSKDQLITESREIEKLLAYKPKHFRSTYEGWDMKRRFEVDFCGDGFGIEQSFIVIRPGRGTQEAPQIRRHSRCSRKIGEGLSHVQIECSNGSEQWRTTELSFGNYRNEEITATAIDNSLHACTTGMEDPLLSPSASPSSSAGTTPLQPEPPRPTVSVIPGQRARFFAIGTKYGSILLWDVRGLISSSSGLVNTLSPVRVIHTDSPQISCLALTALYLVHGGTDGLVQAWDPLASSIRPIRTLNSRFSSRARRMISLTEGTNQDAVGANNYAAGAIFLDPNPMVLRGMVSLGPHLRYWSYSSSGAELYAGRSRRLRRGQRKSNHHNDEPVLGQGRGSLSDYIANERREFARERDDRRKEASRLAGRFGIGLLGDEADDREMLAYAKILSEESFAQDEERRRSENDTTSGESVVLSSSGSSRSSSSQTVTPDDNIVGCASPSSGVGLDDDVAEAVRRSLLNDHDVDHHPDQTLSSPAAEPSSSRISSSSSSSNFRYGAPSSSSTTRYSPSQGSSSALSSNNIIPKQEQG